MTDKDIIDTIAEALTPWEQRTDESHCELQAREAVEALRSAGYRITKDRCEKDYHSTPHMGCILL